MAIKKVVTKPSKKRPGAKPKPSAGRHGGFDVIPGVTWDEHAGPWILTLLIIPGAAMLARAYVFHSWFGRVAAAFGIVTVGGVISLALWHEATARGGWTQARIGLTGLYCTFGLAGTLIWNWDTNWLTILGFIGVAISAWWTAAGSRPMLGRGDDHHDKPDSLAEQLGIPGTTAKPIPGETGGARNSFWLVHPNATIEAVRAAAGLIAVKAGVPPTGVRVVEDPDNARRSKLVITDRDVLSTPTLWPGPSAPGTSIGSSPCRLGVREDGTELELIRPGREPDRKRNISPRPNGHSITGGMNRAGKTEGELVELADLVTRTEVAVLWSDTVKPDQTLRDFAPACSRLATGKAQTQIMVNLLVRSIKARARHLGMHNHRQWEPGCGLTYLIFHFEELAAVAEMLGDNLRKAVAEAGSVGISVSGSMQRPSSYLLETDVRAQFSINWCFGMRNDVDAAMVLSDSTMDAGAHPEAWKNTKPGYCYLEATHVPEQEWSMPARTYLLPAETLRAHVAEWAPRMADIDAVTKKAMGPSLNDLPTGTGYALENGWTSTSAGVLVPPGGVPLAGTPMPSPGWSETGSGDEDGTTRETRRETARETDPGTGDEDDETATRLELESAVDEAAREVAAEYPMDPEMRPDVEAALAAGEPGTPLEGDYEPGEDFELEVGTPGPPPSRAERVEALAVILTLLAAGAADPVDTTTDDLVAEWFRVPGIRPGQRPALYRLLRRLERAGQVEDVGRGGWRVHPGAPRWLRSNLANATDDDTDGDDEGESLAGVL